MHVAVGIVINQQCQVLISKRLAHQYKGGLWEFPGGKVEQGETVFHALTRELEEEIGIQVFTAIPFLQVTYDYKDRNVFLDTWLITQYSGEPAGKEGQDINWVSLSDLDKYTFPDGNRAIIEKLIKGLSPI